jgi:concanavalin A-like lectin/glucanase superfamily protein
MMRRILAIVVGLCACGNGNHLTPDAAADAPADAPSPRPDATPVDASPDAFVDTSLMLRYDFEDTATVVTDSSSRGKNGTLNDIAAWTASGRNNRGLALSGGSPATRFVTFPDGVLTGVSDFTISTWVKPNTIANWVRIYDIGNGAPGTRWMFLTLSGFTGPTNDGVHAASFGGPSNEIISASSTQLPVGVWKHVAVTGSGGVRTVYIDGYPAATATTALAVPPSDMEPIGGNSWIGKSRFPDPGLDGTLDDFRVYNRVLSQAELADLAWPQHDYSYWRFDETSGQTAKDSSDNAVPTALMTGPTWVAGKVGGALDFPGGPHAATGPHAELATSPLANCTDQFTVATWVKMHTLDTWARIIDFGTGPGSSMYLTPFDDQGAGVHGMRFAMFSPTTAFNMSTPTPPLPADDTWHHVAVTVVPVVDQNQVTNEMVTMYVDGAVVLTQLNTTGIKISDYKTTTENYLGKSRFMDTDPYLHAALDDLRISCRAFTADEIKNLAHQ